MSQNSAFKEGLYMGVKIAGLSPHPPLIIPEVGGRRRKEVQKTIDNLKEMSVEIVNAKPDLLITISPHGPIMRDGIAVIYSEYLKGDFRDFGAPQAKYEVKSNLKFIDNLKNKTDSNNIKLTKLKKTDLQSYGFSNELDHGVMVPLHFLLNANLDIPVVAISMGLLDYQTLYKFGKLLDETLDEMDLDGAVLASGDLSHKLKPGAPAGYNPEAENFDKELTTLLSQEKFEEVLKIDKNLIEKAGECGYRPIIMTLGAIQNYDVSSDLKSYEGPFGVGYAVCSFKINDKR